MVNYTRWIFNIWIFLQKSIECVPIITKISLIFVFKIVSDRLYAWFSLMKLFENWVLMESVKITKYKHILQSIFILQILCFNLFRYQLNSHSLCQWRNMIKMNIYDHQQILRNPSWNLLFLLFLNTLKFLWYVSIF